jgi:steroid 5-alpha reductase family enzyme
VHPVLLSLIVSVGINAAFFAYAALRKTDVVTDLSYSLSFASVALILAALRDARDLYRLLTAAMVILWALRLGSYLLGRILSIKVDHRFDDMRDQPLKFARFWILQAVTVVIVLVPVSVVLGGPGSPSLPALSIAGLILWALGLAIESLADAQKSAFKKKGTPGFIRSGVWAWSRHPNYFGESLVWIGVYLYCLPMLGSASLPSLVSPVGITALLLFVSGIPLLEKAADKKFGGQEDYEAYKRATSVFVPLPPRGIRS